MHKPYILKRYFLITACVFLFAVLAMPRFAFAAEESTSCVPTTQQISSLFNEWNSALKAKDLNKIVSLYSNNAVLLPTLSNLPHIGRTAIRPYFIEFLKKNPIATVNSEVIKTGCNWASFSGVYTFKVLDDKGKMSKVKARFSYVYEKIDGAWLIVSHHSSLMPEKKDNDNDDEDDD